jgi:hypothetical protein
MTEKNEGKEPVQKTQAPPYVVRLPGFLLDKETGLGDVIKRVTYRIGIPPCSGCERRAAILNRWVHFNNY